MMNGWKEKGLRYLQESLGTIPTEINPLDWKQDLSPNKARLVQHLSAFGNEPGGGFLVFGINPSGEATGLDTSLANKILGQIGNLARDGITPALRIEHWIENFREKHVLFVHIPESTEKPVHIRGQSIEESFIRSAGQTRKMSKQELGSSLIRSKTTKFEELPAMPHISINSIGELLRVFDLPALYKLFKRPLPSSDGAIIEELKSLRLIVEEQLLPTNLGILVAAKDMTNFRGHERRGIRLIFYKGKSRVETDHETTGRKGYGIGFQGLIHFLLQRLPSSEIIQDALRRTVPLYPEIALRELIANAIIHQDLTADSRSPMIEVFSDRIEISNPGKLVPSLTLSRIIDSSPESRNEMFARFLRQVGICEERGSGIDRALQAIELWGLPPIDFREEDNSFRVVMYGPKTYKQMNRDERIRAAYQHCCLQYLSSSSMTNASLRKRLGVKDSNYPLVSKIINDAVDAKQVKPLDPDNKAKKHIKYIPYWA